MILPIESADKMERRKQRSAALTHLPPSTLSAPAAEKTGAQQASSYETLPCLLPVESFSRPRLNPLPARFDYRSRPHFD